MCFVIIWVKQMVFYSDYDKSSIFIKDRLIETVLKEIKFVIKLFNSI